VNSLKRIADMKIERSSLDLSNERKGTGDMGKLHIVNILECIPSDILDLGISAVVRLQPMVAPILHSIRVRFYSFFIPYRILFNDSASNNWEEFITRGEDGDSAITLPVTDPDDATTPADVVAKGTIWDECGFPVGVIPAAGSCPLDFPRRAYIDIWNEYFRDPNVQAELDFTDLDTTMDILRKNWDQATHLEAALPWRQRGSAPAISVLGTGTVQFAPDYQDLSAATINEAVWPAKYTANATQYMAVTGASATASGDIDVINDETHFDEFWDNLNATVSGSSFSGTDIADLRLAFQLQVWKERNARAGYRYIEQLQSHYSISPNDSRLQRPELIGTSVDDLIVSEVLQT